MAFIEYNPNPVGRRVGDCAVRAIAKALKLDWETAYITLTMNGFSMGGMPSADMSGMPSMRVIDYTIRDSAPKTAEIAPQGNFATKDDVEYLKGEISSLRAKFERLGSGADKRKEKADGK